MKPSPVIQAIIDENLREQELRENALRAVVGNALDLPSTEGDRSGWPIFKAWCELQDITPYPARPACVAYFILEHAGLGIDELLRIVKSISLVHGTVADPTASGAVPRALNKILPVTVPVSWPKAERTRFADLPYETQRYLSTRDIQVRREIGRVQSDAAKARQELAAIIEPKVTHGDQSHATA
jgi:hypothetical protein